MSTFTTPLVLELLGHYKWRVYEEFEFFVNDDGSDVIKIPKGYTTDLASVPRCLWAVLPPHGKWAKAAVVHDYLYDHALRTKQEADNIFYQGLMVLGVPSTKARLMYWAVRLFGRGKYV